MKLQKSAENYQLKNGEYIIIHHTNPNWHGRTKDGKALLFSECGGSLSIMEGVCDTQYDVLSYAGKQV